MTISLTTRRFLKTGGALAVALTLAACGKKEEAAPAAAASAADAPPARVYVVGTDAAYAPFESQNEKGEIVGFDIDVVSAVAQKAGIQVKFVNTPWEGMFNTVAQGDRDLLVSAITIPDSSFMALNFAARTLVLGVSTLKDSTTARRPSRASWDRMEAIPARYIFLLIFCVKFSSGRLGKMRPPPRHRGEEDIPARARPVPFCLNGLAVV